LSEKGKQDVQTYRRSVLGKDATDRNRKFGDDGVGHPESGGSREQLRVPEHRIRRVCSSSDTGH
jgi:hypothetical protein